MSPLVNTLLFGFSNGPLIFSQWRIALRACGVLAGPGRPCVCVSLSFTQGSKTLYNNRAEGACLHANRCITASQSSKRCLVGKSGTGPAHDRSRRSGEVKVGSEPPKRQQR